MSGPLRRRRAAVGKARGRRGEDLAVALLEREGYVIEARNVFVGRGEIDVVAKEGEVLCFIEVRTRANARFGTPEATVSPAKRRKLERAAEAYLGRTPPPWPRCRFDVVAVAGAVGDERLRLVRHAFAVGDGSAR